MQRPREGVADGPVHLTAARERLLPVIHKHIGEASAADRHATKPIWPQSKNRLIRMRFGERVCELQI